MSFFEMNPDLITPRIKNGGVTSAMTHGNSNTYKAGCRCRKCTKGQADAARKYRSSRAGRNRLELALPCGHTRKRCERARMHMLNAARSGHSYSDEWTHCSLLSAYDELHTGFCTFVLCPVPLLPLSPMFESNYPWESRGCWGPHGHHDHSTGQPVGVYHAVCNMRIEPFLDRIPSEYMPTPHTVGI